MEAIMIAAVESLHGVQRDGDLQRHSPNTKGTFVTLRSR